MGKAERWKYYVITLILAVSFSLGGTTFWGTHPAQAKDSRAAIVVSLQGTVMVTKAGGSNSYRAFEEMSLNQGDHIKTEAGSSITLQIVDQEDEVTIGENTELYISSLVEAAGGKKSKLKVWAGSLWFKVKKLVNAEDEFEVETPTAVMGVRGSNGYIETKLGQIFAIMASGVLNASSTGNENEDASASANIYPGQQFTLPDSGAGVDPSVGVAPLNIEEFVSRANPAMIVQLIETIQQIAEENQTFIEQVGTGTKQVDPKSGLTLSDAGTLSQFGGNLTNLVANIAKVAKDTNKVDAKEMDTLIAKVNESLTGEKIDLANVKPFDKTIATDPEVLKAKEAELARLEAERKQKQDEARLQEEERARQNAALLAQLEAEKAKQEEANRQAQQQQKQQTEETYKQGLGEAEKARFEADKQRTDQQQQQQGGQQPGTQQPGTQQPGTQQPGTGTQQPGSGSEEPEVPPPGTPVVKSPVASLTTNAANVTIRVGGIVGNTIRLWNSSQKLGEQVVGSSGEVVFEVALAEGPYSLQVDAINTAGTLSSRISVPAIRVDRTAPQPPSIAPLPTYWNAGSLRQLQVTAELGSQLQVFLNEQSVPFFTSTVTSATYEVVPVTVGGDGAYTFRATATDAAGNVSGAASASVVVDTVGPAAPSVNAPAYWNALSTKRELTITAEAGSTVKVYKGSEAIPFYSETIGTIPLVVTIDDAVAGDNVYRVTATDAALNVSEATSVTVKLDTTAPNAPEVTAPAYWNALSTKRELTITAEAGSTVKVYKGSEATPFYSETIGTIPSVVTIDDAVAGDNVYRVTATDAALNVSEAAEVTVKLDTSAP
ncbi:FecR domain-containing protein, partial [Paenibacillus sp. HJGM_3]|uniref:FecR domain-containing protein n=1 Tax=Paenibacillus sp. HJGM_3 TaxID=3379816 RepID=UPI00385B487D